jgi:DNA-binding MarR family transcriptional regulator
MIAAKKRALPRSGVSAGKAAPADAARRQAASGPPLARDATVNQYLAAYLMGLANRLTNGASNHYRRHWNIGMSEWRALIAVAHSNHRIVREVAEMADLDYAAASKSLKLLKARGFVEIEQTNRRGRASMASLTPAGLVLYQQLNKAAKARQKRLLAAFNAAETEQLWTLLRRLELQIPYMNAEP